MKDFLRSTPEAQGVSSKDVLQFLKHLEEHRIPMHSFLLARHDHVIFEGYYAPLQKDSLHRMYSETKSFVSMAIGILEAEGKLKLTDRICDYFPEYLPGNVHPWLKEVTIENMLKMETCYDMTVYTKNSPTENWTRSFFRATPTHRPGTVFQYDTSGTQTLGGLVLKLTGKDPLTFLKERGLSELGFSDESYIMARPGHTRNGSGLMAKTSDMMRVLLMLAHGGKDPETGKQIVPEDYVKRATSPQTSVTPNVLMTTHYGYQFWVQPDDHFMMYGMGSNDSICYFKKDICVAYNADTQMIPEGSAIINRDLKMDILDRVSETPLPEDPAAYQELMDYLKKLAVPVMQDTTGGENLQSFVNGKTFGFAQNKNDFQEMKLKFQGDEGVFSFEKKEEKFEIPFGLGKNVFCPFPGYKRNTYSSGAWVTSDTFVLNCQVIDAELSSVFFKFAFLPDGGLTVKMHKSEEVDMNEYLGLLCGEML